MREGQRGTSDTHPERGKVDVHILEPDSRVSRDVWVIERDLRGSNIARDVDGLWDGQYCNREERETY